MAKPTFVTKPFLPPLAELMPYLEQIWQTGVLSNNGPFHQQLESSLKQYLGVPQVSLFCNATIALVTAQQALRVEGEVITTPYSFAATAHSIVLAGNQPVFADIMPDCMTLDPASIESQITERTAAIMPVHCYGNTCDVEGIQRIAQRYGLKVIYDACHSFGITDEAGSVLKHGDMSAVSFHATKVFNTFEGGMLVSNTPEEKELVDRFKNFGFVDETTVTECGGNGKMSEFSAALGLLQLQYLDEAIAARRASDLLYRDLLNKVEGITCLTPIRQRNRNYSYFPILVGPKYGRTRDELYEFLKSRGIYARRYFYPLISDFPMYAAVPSANSGNLSVARRVSDQILCLPLHPFLAREQAIEICDLIAGDA